MNYNITIRNTNDDFVKQEVIFYEKNVYNIYFVRCYCY